MISGHSLMPDPRMTHDKLHLRKLRVEDERSFRMAVEEFRQFQPEWTFAFYFEDSTNFADYVRQLELWSKGNDLPGNFVPNTFLVGIVNDVVVGRISIRHTLNNYLARIGGHIGYGVIPSQRQRGHANEMLRQLLPIAASLDIHQLLVTCDDDNLPSRRVIEKNGGVFEKLITDPESPVPTRRYWIDVLQQLEL